MVRAGKEISEWEIDQDKLNIFYVPGGVRLNKCITAVNVVVNNAIGGQLLKQAHTLDWENTRRSQEAGRTHRCIYNVLPGYSMRSCAMKRTVVPHSDSKECSLPELHEPQVRGNAFEGLTR